jgi:hypothetical protein
MVFRRTGNKQQQQITIQHSTSINRFFCSTLLEFENFLLCERILINMTTCQNETSS